MIPCIALVTAAPARDVDEDLPFVVDALARLDENPSVDVVDWDDPGLDWSAYDVAVIRSTWDYTLRYDEFVAWLDRAGASTRVCNPPELVRWNSDKRYLRELSAAGVATVPATFVSAGSTAELPPSDELVVKPSVGAGSRDAARYRSDDRSAITAHVERLHASGRTAMIQPYVASVDSHGEAALLYFDGEFSHAITKGPLLTLGAAPTRALFAPERIGPRDATDDERGAADAVIDVIGRLDATRGLGLGGRPPTYARVDLLASALGEPLVLELEVCEPSLFLGTAPGAADRYAAAVMAFARR